MDRGQRPGTSDFSLETDDRTEDERPQAESVKKDLLVSALGMSGSDSPKTPMDTDYSEEMEPTTPKIKFNLNFDKKIRNVEEPKEVRDSKRFDIKRLFEAATSGDVMQLDGLHQYLHQSMKKLTNSEYQTHGKNVLMKALLNLRDGKNNTVEFLLEISERMGDIKEFVNAAYTNSYYKGQTSLHVAIERRSIYYVRMLVSKGADVHAKACGTFFQPHDGANFYFGELPLSLAACTNQPEVVDFLMENEYESADAQQTDSQGNTVLHALVVVADNTKENTEFLTSMYDHILTTTARLHPKQRLEEIENNKGLTPLKLAAKTGKIGIFEHILHREFQETHTKHLSRKFTEWVYGPVHSSLYDLASLDSFEDNSVLEILVYGCDIPNRHEMLQIEPLGRLLEEKWTRFAGRIFFLNFLVYLVYLVVFTLVAYHKGREPPFRIEHTVKGYLYVSGQLLVVLASCYFFVRGIKDLKKRRPKLQMLLIDGYCEILFFLQAVLFLVSVVLYFCKRQEYLAFVVVCLALSWVNLLYFSRGYRHMGIYSVMIQKMILGDIMRFLFVYFVFLFGFSAAVVTLLIEPPEKNITTPPGQSRLFASTGEDCQKPSFRNISYTTLELFKFTIGIGDLEFTEEYQYKEVFYVLLIGYIVLTYILLFNMLIALMSRTVEKITSESTSIWRLQRAITILDLERRLPHCLKRRLRCGVEKDLSKTAGQDRRWCFRVEEVNWNKWNINLGIINEDPGSSDHLRLHTSHSSPRRERSWRGFFRDVSRRHLEPRYRQHTQQSTEMRPLATSPV
ncbi:transient receptor potential cation channel subfamily V member 1 [Myripristis murdjan]|uniref:Transient receptor potential cation channel, subfamily V, member 1 n=1 Tax=Myripristis murdjan TaxID=586833 RepID=A0A667ZTU2_9TELE|nr:transient receptor potential cation channel subfamily V member 1-like [Myripristis murdjan]XP_029924155.1 transient receptor potential cation channel subfamily V member 1-like [Myripristis murdjan]